MLPHDLAGLIAFDPLGSAVPGQHMALGVEQKEGIIGDAVDEELKDFFTLHLSDLSLLAGRLLGLHEGIGIGGAHQALSSSNRSRGTAQERHGPLRCNSSSLSHACSAMEVPSIPPSAYPGVSP